MTVAQQLNIREDYQLTKTVYLDNDRILVLKGIDDKKPLTSTGLVASRLFKGDNELHATYEGQSGLWYLKYEKGLLPEPLKQKFTSFKVLREFCNKYFNDRNIEITEVKNAPQFQ